MDDLEEPRPVELDRPRLAQALRDAGLWPGYPEFTNVWREQANKIADAYEALEPEPASGPPPRPIRGEVGTLEGPPIAGTTDSVNSGAARPDG